MRKKVGTETVFWMGFIGASRYYCPKKYVYQNWKGMSVVIGQLDLFWMVTNDNTVGTLLGFEQFIFTWQVYTHCNSSSRSRRACCHCHPRLPPHPCRGMTRAAVAAAVAAQDSSPFWGDSGSRRRRVFVDVVVGGTIMTTTQLSPRGDNVGNLTAMCCNINNECRTAFMGKSAAWSQYLHL